MNESSIQFLLTGFRDFCTNDIVSNKANSYMLAVKYLCEFLEIRVVNKSTYEVLTKSVNGLRDKNSCLYRDCLTFLARRRQSSYLEKGYINAAFNQFKVYVKIHLQLA